MTCVSCRVQNKFHRMTTEWKQNCSTLRTSAKKKKKKKGEKKTTSAAQTPSYYKYAKLMTAVESRMLTHTKAALNVIVAHEP